MPSMRRLAVTTLGIGAAQLGKGQNILDETGSWKAGNLAEDENSGALQVQALWLGGKLGNGGSNAALGLATRILHGNDWA